MRARLCACARVFVTHLSDSVMLAIPPIKTVLKPGNDGHARDCWMFAN